MSNDSLAIRQAIQSLYGYPELPTDLQQVPNHLLISGLLFQLIGTNSRGSTPRAAELEDRSGVIGVAGQSQVVMPENPERLYSLFINPLINPVSMWINYGQAAIEDSPSIEILPGGSWPFEHFVVPKNALNVFCSQAGLKYTAKEMSYAD